MFRPKTLFLIMFVTCVGILYYSLYEDAIHNTWNTGNIAGYLHHMTEKWPKSEKPHHNVPNLTYDKTKPLIVVLVAYQRTGSTFIGNLFNQNPDAFYVFEPLAYMYVSLYGTQPNGNPPTDITTYWNGSIRHQPEVEITATAQTLEQLLSCHHGDLPLELALSHFWHGFYLEHRALQSGFLPCLSKHGITRKIESHECRKETRNVHKLCGNFFGENWNNLLKCRDKLWPVENRSKVTDEVFVKHWECFEKKMRPIANMCVPKMKEVCEKSRIRAVKIVRPGMNAIPALLKRFGGNLRVIHLFRKPSAVSVSRKRNRNLHAHASSGQQGGLVNNTPILEAGFYCRNGVMDIKLRKQMEELYPQIFMQIIYEDFNANKNNTLQKIYKFLGFDSVPKTVNNYFLNSKFRPSKASGWNQPSNDINNKIDESCEEFYKLLGYRWNNY